MPVKNKEGEFGVEPEVVESFPTICSHHLRFVGAAMGLGVHAGTPESVAAAFTTLVLGWVDSDDPYRKRYANTTVRINGKDTSEEYQNALTAGILEFVDAPEDQKFTIVEDATDSVICARMEARGLADHCRRRLAELPEGGFSELDERRDTNRFLLVLRKFDDISYEIVPGMSNFVDAEQITVRRITLTAGEIRRVLRFMGRPKSPYIKFFDFPNE